MEISYMYSRREAELISLFILLLSGTRVLVCEVGVDVAVRFSPATSPDEVRGFWALAAPEVAH